MWELDILVSSWRNKRIASYMSLQLLLLLFELKEGFVSMDKVEDKDIVEEDKVLMEDAEDMMVL